MEQQDHREGPVMSTISGEGRVCVEGSLLKMAKEVAWINEELMECHKKSNVIGQTVPKISEDLEESSTGKFVDLLSNYIVEVLIFVTIVTLAITINHFQYAAALDPFKLGNRTDLRGP